MAKFRKKVKRVFARYKKSVRRPGSSANLLTTALAAGVYGAGRQKIEEYIAPYTSKMPIAGNYTDEVVLGTLGYFMAKGKIPFFKGKLARSAGTAIVTIEAARIGSGIVSGISVSNNGQSNFNVNY